MGLERNGSALAARSVSYTTTKALPRAISVILTSVGVHEVELVTRVTPSAQRSGFHMQITYCSERGSKGRSGIAIEIRSSREPETPVDMYYHSTGCGEL